MAREEEIKKAQDAAYRHLAVRARSQAEVRERLREKGYSFEVTEAVVKKLEGLGYLNDHEFALGWARSQVKRRHLGRLGLREELMRRGLSRDIIDQTVKEIYEECQEREVAHELVRKKMRGKAVHETQELRRLSDFLRRRGFSYEVIKEVLKKGEKE